MLQVVNEAGAKKTQIMYKANLSYNLLKKYLADIVEAYLIRFERKAGCYIITLKGKMFLERYMRYNQKNEHLVQRLDDLNSEKRVLEDLCSSS
jgi:predicted transcriptional regulator